MEIYMAEELFIAVVVTSELPPLDATTSKCKPD
jgi:hypothetical protein